jgi:hypothetical protein
MECKITVVQSSVHNILVIIISGFFDTRRPALKTQNKHEEEVPVYSIGSA